MVTIRLDGGFVIDVVDDSRRRVVRLNGNRFVGPSLSVRLLGYRPAMRRLGNSVADYRVGLPQFKCRDQRIYLDRERVKQLLSVLENFKYKDTIFI